MCLMTDCCFYCPLRWGCLVASVIECILAALELVLYFVGGISHHEEKSAAWIADMCLILMCSILLFVGSLKEERVCVILHSLFMGVLLFAELIFQSVVFQFSFFQGASDWVIVYTVVYHCFFIYMVPTGLSYATQLRDKSYSETNTIGPHRHRLMSSAMSSELYGV